MKIYKVTWRGLSISGHWRRKDDGCKGIYAENTPQLYVRSVISPIWDGIQTAHAIYYTRRYFCKFESRIIYAQYWDWKDKKLRYTITRRNYKTLCKLGTKKAFRADRYRGGYEDL